MCRIRWRRSGEDSTLLGRRLWRVRREWISELRRSRNVALNFSRCWWATPTKTLWIRGLLETESAAACSPELRPLKLDVFHAIPAGNSRPNSSDNPLSILGPISSIIRGPFRLRNPSSKLSPFFPNIVPHHECQIHDDHPGRDTIKQRFIDESPETYAVIKIF